MLRTLLAVSLATMLAGCSIGGGPEVAASPAPAGPMADDMPSPELQAVIGDVRRMAPALEDHLRGTAYPRTLEEAGRAMDDADLSLGEGTSLGAYRYDPDTIEFELCIEHASGAFATYDTAPMSTRDVGETGGCPEL